MVIMYRELVIWDEFYRRSPQSAV